LIISVQQQIHPYINYF